MPYFRNGKNGIHLHFVNKHLSCWALLGFLTFALQGETFRIFQPFSSIDADFDGSTLDSF